MSRADAKKIKSSSESIKNPGYSKNTRGQTISQSIE
jgi:hypothetical protein